MKAGDEVRLHAPLSGQDLAKFLNSYGGTREVYVRVEGEVAVLYLVNRVTDRPDVGTVFATRTIPLLPEEV
jgi:hypothetical protein